MIEPQDGDQMAEKEFAVGVHGRVLDVHMNRQTAAFIDHFLKQLEPF